MTKSIVEPTQAAAELLAAARYCVQFSNNDLSPVLRKRLEAAIAYASGDATRKQAVHG